MSRLALPFVNVTVKSRFRQAKAESDTYVITKRRKGRVGHYTLKLLHAACMHCTQNKFILCVQKIPGKK